MQDKIKASYTQALTLLGHLRNSIKETVADCVSQDDMPIKEFTDRVCTAVAQVVLASLDTPDEVAEAFNYDGAVED